MKLADIVCVDAIIPHLESTERDAVIHELIEALQKSKKLGKISPKVLAKTVIKRENEASTGIGKGVAVPHVKCETVKEPVAAVGCSPDGINFASLDKQPVYSVFLLLSPTDQPDKHLQAMETIFRNLQKDDFRRFLRQVRNREDVVEAIKDADESSAD